MELPHDAILPKTKPAALRLLTEEQYSSWITNGYIAIADCVPLDLCKAASKAIQTFVGPDWYANTLDIYTDLVPTTQKRPKHGPCGMVQMYHHDSFWRIRQHPNVHAAFTDVYGTEKLWVTVDRAHFKPPEHPDHPAWGNAGPVHTGLHWDVSVDTLPIPMAVQGIVYLEDTNIDEGPLHVLAGSFHRIAALREQRRLCGPESFATELTPIPGRAGTLVLWHSATLHGPSRNTGTDPRISMYVAMTPVDATPFQPPGVSPSAALSLADAGTLAYDEHGSSVSRLGREQRVARWKERRPLLDEDPREEEVEAWPPGEVNAPPFAHLTPLGRKLVGLDAW